MLPADAMTLGNHEFDHGIEGVVPFLETLNSPVLVANMDSINEPTMTEKYKKSMIIERSGRKIGIIGVILETTYNLADTGKLIFRNESDAIRKEAEKLKKVGANIIIVLSHCGYDQDKLIARMAGSEIDVIVGSHSHTFLFTGKNRPGPERPAGDYPTEVIHESGHRVLIVQAAAYAKYVGNLTVYFDDAGDMVSFDGAPIYMDNDVPQDEDVLRALAPWKKVIDLQGARVIGLSKVDLLKGPCGSRECNLGNFFTDAMVHAFVKLTPYNQTAWSNVSIGLINTGALRVPLSRGNLTYSALVAMSPFENTLVAFNLPGKILVDTLEYSVRQINLKQGITSAQYFMQVAGLKVSYNFSLPMGSRVIDVKVRCSYCHVPLYEPLDRNKYYRIVAPNFLVGGGDGFSMIRDHASDLQEEMTDLEALIDYVEMAQPIITGIEGRISILNSN